jgi:hypothetical protein
VAQITAEGVDVPRMLQTGCWCLEIHSEEYARNSTASNWNLSYLFEVDSFPPCPYPLPFFSSLVVHAMSYLDVLLGCIAGH